eukprot:CAMPEP_0194423008 /NCGR_PEP_ID=MMETSP0176-20130528/22337_1 /TAXON_ID=216777 /ORGANISM="Proboscia alata, Strain PI-D3" /LENGTH=104 /DNA_ID=CAMNT_0039232067 /DNA_START=126 /DNA_END=436 /DNA_ORIENTATION=+
MLNRIKSIKKSASSATSSERQGFSEETSSKTPKARLGRKHKMSSNLMQTKKSTQKPSFVVVGNDCIEDEISTGLSLEDVSVKIENEEKKELEHVLRGDKIPTSP